MIFLETEITEKLGLHIELISYREFSLENAHEAERLILRWLKEPIGFSNLGHSEWFAGWNEDALDIAWFLIDNFELVLKDATLRCAALGMEVRHLPHSAAWATP